MRGLQSYSYAPNMYACPEYDGMPPQKPPSGTNFGLQTIFLQVRKKIAHRVSNFALEFINNFYAI